MRWSSALVGALLAAPGLAHAADPTPVIAAERAFAARAAEVGVPRSFLDFMAEDAIVFAPDATPAKALYSARLPGKAPAEGGPRLVWWPNFAGLAASGDLGFTTGPAEIEGVRYAHYFTVWKRQADGAWKWIYDGGTDIDPAVGQGPEAPVRALASGAARPLAPAAAFAQVQAAEAALASAARADLPAAYSGALAPDALVQGSRLGERPKSVAFTPAGGEASKAGDLAWTWGDATWPGRRAHYVRIWQRRDIGWRLVFDQFEPVEAK